jgi:hypothetical protein
MGKKAVSRLLPLFGILFITAYIRSATVNVVYTDYMRLVNSYLNNVFSFEPYMHADILTRIPVSFPERIVNVVFFRYSTMFDMMMGALGLGVIGFTAASYCVKRNISLGMMIAVLIVIFSLDKWEMLTNGSGWVHFAAFGLFWYHYLVYDRELAGEGKPGDGKRLLILPWIIILLFAGPYGAIYAVTFIIADLFAMTVMKKDAKDCLKRIVCMAVSLFLYILSRHFSVEDRAGATTESVFTVISADPSLIPLLFIRSFSSMIAGAEMIRSSGAAGAVSLTAGIFVIGCYAYAFLLNFRKRLYERSTFPLLLLTSGFLNHVLITCSRWIFLNSYYGMSSRYALQYGAGIVGILLTVSMAVKKENAGTEADAKRPVQRRRTTGKAAAVIIAAVFVTGNLLTTAHEIGMAPYRKENFTAMRDTALNFENRTDAELVKILQYHDAEKTRKALTLLKERHLNVYE